MSSAFKWIGNLNICKVLLRDHDEARAEIVQARMEGGRIADAAERVARLCLPHFEEEEKRVFPVLALLPDLKRGNLRPEMMDVLPLISDFKERHEALHDHHRSITSAIEALLEAANTEKNGDCIELAYRLRIHEWIEDEAIYPKVVLIGNYLQENFAN